MSTILKQTRRVAAALAVAAALVPQVSLAHGGGGMGGMSSGMHSMSVSSHGFPKGPPFHNQFPRAPVTRDGIGLTQGSAKLATGSGTGATNQGTSFISKFNQANVTSHKQPVGAPPVGSTPPTSGSNPSGGNAGGTTGGAGGNSGGTTGGTTIKGPPSGVAAPISKGPPVNAPPTNGNPPSGGSPPGGTNPNPTPTPVPNPIGGGGFLFPFGFGGLGFGGYGGASGGTVAGNPVTSGTLAADATPIATTDPTLASNPVAPASYVAAAPAAGTADLVLEDVHMVAKETLVASPAYRVAFRNQGTAAAGPFRVGIFAVLEGRLTKTRALVDVPGLAAGEAAEVTLRLPQSSLMLVSSHGRRMEFDKLAVMVDVDQRVQESDKSNNIAAVQRSVLDVAE